MPPTSSNDDATDRQLRLFVGLVVVLAICGAGVVVAFTAAQPPTPTNFAVVGLIFAAIILASWLRVRFRVLASQDVTTWVEVPVLIGLVLVPGPWVILSTACAIAALRIARRRPA